MKNCSKIDFLLDFVFIMNKIYYDYSKIDSYPCPIRIVVSQRGLGKTFGKVKMCIERFIDKGQRFIYVVETGEMVHELARNNGEKFFASILKYYEEQDTARKRYYYNHLISMEINDEDGETITRRATIRSGTIFINNMTAGYVIDMNAFGELKRNNFVDISTIIVDEFISEKLDKTTLQNPRKISSIIQSVARLNDKIKIYLLGNAVRRDDPILSRMGFKIKEFGFYKKYDSKGLVAVLHFVDPKEYKRFNEKHSKSVAGRLSRFLNEDNEEKNEFLENVPEEKRLSSFNYRKGGFSINLIKDDNIITLKELMDGTMAVVPFSNSPNCTTLYCLTDKEQGYYKGRIVICNLLLKKQLTDLLKADAYRYYSEVEYATLKYIIKGD